MSQPNPLPVAALAVLCVFSGLTFPLASGAQLTVLGNHILEQGRGDIEGTAEAGDRFGGSFAVGDFDGDGFDDLAVGVDGEDFSGAPESGLVQVFYGSSRGLTGSRDVTLSQDTAGVPGVRETGDRFGFALAALDIDCDGFDDLAIGIPFEDISDTPARTDAGSVAVLFGSASGLSGSGAVGFDGNDWPQGDGAGIDDELGFALVGVSNGSTTNPVRRFYAGAPGERVSAPDQPREGAIYSLASFCDAQGLVPTDRLHQNSTGVSSSAEPTDAFGSTLGKGDFNGDGIDDLSVAAIHEDFSLQDVGIVHVFYGSADGSWSGADEESWTQDSPGILDQTDVFEEFGHALSSGDFDGDGFDDLVAGVGENNDGVRNSGAAHVIYGGSGGLSEAGDQLWSQAGSIVGALEEDDGFGLGVAVGDFDGDGADDLAAGVPSESIGSLLDAGAVNVIYGVRFFGLDVPGNEAFDQDTAGLSSTAAEAEDGFGSAVAAGDWNGDGRDDLAIGVPGEDAGSSVDSGIVQILYGSNAGVLSSARFTTANVFVVTEQTIVLGMSVERIGATNLALSVGHRLAPGGTATAGLDFEYTPGTLSWAAGEAGAKLLVFRLLGDVLTEPTEFAHFELHSPSAGGATATPSRRTLQINDAPADPTLFIDGFETGNTAQWSAVVP